MFSLFSGMKDFNARRFRLSRKVRNINYDQDSQTLEIFFNNNISKIYCEIPAEAVQLFEKAADKTLFYLEKIDGRYPLV